MVIALNGTEYRLCLLDTNAVTALARANAFAWGHASRMAPGDSLRTCFVVVGQWEYGLDVVDWTGS